jgi:hypothetical protein
MLGQHQPRDLADIGRVLFTEARARATVQTIAPYRSTSWSQWTFRNRDHGSRCSALKQMTEQANSTRA